MFLSLIRPLMHLQNYKIRAQLKVQSLSTLGLRGIVKAAC